MLVKYKVTEGICFRARVIPDTVLLPLWLVFMMENDGIKRTVKLIQ